MNRQPVRAVTIGLAAALLLTACAPAYDVDAVVAEIHANQTAVAQATASAGTPEPQAVPLPALAGLPAFAGQPLPVANNDLFATSGVCAACHTRLRDAAGNDVSNDAFWRSTMMANSGRDPYWQASVRAETLANPALQAVIEDKCTTCHMPMARTTSAAAGGAGVLLDVGYASPQNALHTFAQDGVSCTLCHQIEPDGFGEVVSYSGHYAIDLALPAGARHGYGPFPVAAGLDVVMQGASGFLPVERTHIQRSEQCATCHTLYTPYVDAAGEVAGEFPEQMPYLEWLNSSYADQQSCQDCHMPEASGGVQLSITGGPAREPFRRHEFVGGNSTMLVMLRAAGESIGVTASSEQFDATIARMLHQMQTQTAEVAIENAALEGSTLSADLVITSLVGHKFPSGFPSRRVWLHITVQDAAGNVVFESGAYDEQGMIAGNANDADPAAYEPHHMLISDPGQVQIYEAIMGDTEGQPTTTLLRAASYLKDNRLLPAGFDRAAASPDIAVYGQAADDAAFTGGGDTVALAVDTGGAAGPFTLTVELLYQSISYRWAENLRSYTGPELDTFFGLYDGIPNLPVPVARAEARIGE